MPYVFNYPFNPSASEKNDAPDGLPYTVERTETIPIVLDGELITAPHHNSLKKSIVGTFLEATSIDPQLYRYGLEQFIGPLWSRLHDTWSQGYEYRSVSEDSGLGAWTNWDFDPTIPYDLDDPTTRINANMYQQENRIKTTIYDIDNTGVVEGHNELTGVGTILGRIRYGSADSYVYNNSLKYCYLDADTAKDWPADTDHNLRRQRLLSEYWWIYNDTQTIYPGTTQPWAYVYDATLETLGATYSSYGQFTIKLGNPSVGGVSYVEYFDIIPWSPYNEGSNFYTDVDPVLNVSVVYKPALSVSQADSILAETAEAPVFRIGISVFDVNHEKLGDYYCDVAAAVVPVDTVIPWTKVAVSFVPKYNNSTLQGCITVADIVGNKCYTAEVEVGASVTGTHYSAFSDEEKTGYIAYIRPFIWREHASYDIDFGDADIYVAKIDVYEGSKNYYNIDLTQCRVCDTVYFGKGDNAGITAPTGDPDNGATTQIPLYIDTGVDADSDNNIFLSTSQITHINSTTAGAGSPGDSTTYSNLAELIDLYITKNIDAYLAKVGDTIVYTTGGYNTSELAFDGTSADWPFTTPSGTFDLTYILSNLSIFNNDDIGETIWNGSFSNATGWSGGFYVGPVISAYNYLSTSGISLNIQQPYIEAYTAGYEITPTEITNHSVNGMPTIDVAATGSTDTTAAGGITFRDYFRRLVAGETPAAPSEVAMRVFGSLTIANMPTTASFGTQVTISDGLVDGIDIANHNHRGGTSGLQIPIAGLTSQVTDRMFDSTDDKTDVISLIENDGEDKNNFHKHHVDQLLACPTLGDLGEEAYFSTNHSHCTVVKVYVADWGLSSEDFGYWQTVTTDPAIITVKPRMITLAPMYSSATAACNLCHSWKCIWVSDPASSETSDSYEFYGPTEVRGYNASGTGDSYYTLINGLVGLGDANATDPALPPPPAPQPPMATPIRVVSNGSYYVIWIRNLRYWIKDSWYGDHNWEDTHNDLIDIPDGTDWWKLVIHY